MSLQKFDLAAIVDIDDGRIRTALEQALRRCELDCRDRPGLEGKRSVKLEVRLSPVPTPEGELDSVDVSFAISEKIPPRASKSYNMRAARGGLLFNELSPEDCDQMTLDLGPKAEEVANAR